MSSINLPSREPPQRAIRRCLQMLTHRPQRPRIGPSIDPAEFQPITVPPRCSKTLITSVCFPAWLWTQRSRTYLKGPQVKILAASYGHTLSILNSNQTRRLILSAWFQSLWGRRFKLMEDQNTKLRFDTDAGGSRISTSVGGSLLGIGGDVVICDDLHDVSGIESEADRECTVQRNTAQCAKTISLCCAW
jgi:hypothetical protein